MASRDTLILTAACNEPPAAGAATADTRNAHPVLDFDDTANESAVFAGALPVDYAYGGLVVEVHFAMTEAVEGDVDWLAAFERIGRDVQDLDADGFAAAKSAADNPVPGRCGNLAVARLEFADGAEIDYAGPGDAFRLKVTRDAASDTAVGDAQLRLVVVREK